MLLNINEMLAGFRMFPSYIRIGGLREDLPAGFHEAVNAFLDDVPREARRVRRPADEEPDLAEAHAGRRRHHEAGHDELRPGRPDGARLPACRTTCARRSRTSATRPTTSTCRPARRATSTTAIWCAIAEMRQSTKHRAAGARAHHAARRLRHPGLPHRAAAEGQGLHRDGSADSALPDLLAGLHRAGRRGLRAGRGAARRARLQHRVGRHRTGRTGSSCARRRSTPARRCRS